MLTNISQKNSEKKSREYSSLLLYYEDEQMGFRSARGISFDSFLKFIGFLFTSVGLLVVYSTMTSIGQLGEGSWLFTFIGLLLMCLGLFLILARTM